jgi:hypothetical protein
MNHSRSRRTSSTWPVSPPGRDVDVSSSEGAFGGRLAPVANLVPYSGDDADESRRSRPRAGAPARDATILAPRVTDARAAKWLRGRDARCLEGLEGPRLLQDF